MKRIPWPIVLVLFVVAIFFAYRSFLSSFFPRLGAKPLGNPGMPPAAVKWMKEHPEVQAKARSRQTEAKKPNAQHGSHAASTTDKPSGAAQESEKDQTKGGE